MAAQGWASLPADLVNRVADCLLATNDLDCYTDLRAVCHHWRSSTADPRSKDNQLDPRFRPSRWILLDEHRPSASAVTVEDGAVLFVNTSTGRFVRRSLPLLHDHDCYAFITSTTDGLVILAAREPPHAVSVLNPFTGSLLRFAAPLPSYPGPRLTAEVVVGSSLPTLVLVSVATNSVYWAYTKSESFSKKSYDVGHCLASRLPQMASAVVSQEHEPVHFPGDMNIFDQLLSEEAAEGCRGYAVVTAGGEILAILKRHLSIDVFKIDAAGNVMERVESIGNQALFLGVRCLVVDTDCFPTVEPNCAYFQLTGLFEGQIYVLKIGIGIDVDEEGQDLVAGADMDNMCPQQLTEVLCSYTMDIPWHPLTWEKHDYFMPDSYDDYIDYVHDEFDSDEDYGLQPCSDFFDDTS